MIPSSLRWMLLFTVLIVPQVLGPARHATAHTGKNVARYRGGSE
jgi:hypothetical protein